MNRKLVFALTGIVLSCIVLGIGCPVELEEGTAVVGTATVADVTIEGKAGAKLSKTYTVTITLKGGATFRKLKTADYDDWIINAPGGVTQKLKSALKEGDKKAVINVSGTPADEWEDPLEITITADALSSGEDLDVYENKGAVWAITEADGTVPDPVPDPVPVTASVGDVTIPVSLGTMIASRDVVITLAGAQFKALSANDDVTAWFTNIPAGLGAKIRYPVGAGSNEAAITISGTPTATSTAALEITIPGTALI